MKQRTKKFWYSALSFALMLGMMLGIVGNSIEPTYASGSNPSILQASKINYSDYFPGSTWTTNFYVRDGQYHAYCLEAFNSPLPSGDYSAVQLSSNDYPLLWSVLRHGYGGLNDITDDYWGDDIYKRYLMTHIAASYAFSGGDHKGITDEQLESELGPFLRDCASRMSDGSGYVYIIPSPSAGVQTLGYFGEYFPPTPPASENKVHNLSLIKQDSEKTVAQGNASLAGAVYGLYYNDGTLYEERTTDASGNCSWEDIGNGEYYVKEITPSTGYTLDTTRYDVVFTNDSETISYTDASGTVHTINGTTINSLEVVIKQPISITKIDIDANKPLASVGFSAYLKSSLTTNADGTYNFNNATPVPLAQDGSTVLRTDANGVATSIPLPYGTYVIREVEVPAGYRGASTQEVTINTNKPTDPIMLTFYNEQIKTLINLQKKDSATNTDIHIAGIEFKVFDISNNKYVTMQGQTSFYTNANGNVVLPQTLPHGQYRIEEISGPNGYVVDTNYPIVTVGTSTNYQVDPSTGEWYTVSNVDYYNRQAQGRLDFTKTGLTLTRFENGQFVWEEHGLVGAEFTVYADGDIYSADNQQRLVYADGDKVGTLTTDANGKGVLTNLPLGDYTLVETKAPSGYVIDRTPISFSVEYVNDATPTVVVTQSSYNERQKIVLDITKQEGENNTALAGSEFGLYADSNILNYNGTVIVNKGDLIATAVSDDNGKVNFGVDLPFASYRVEEIKAPASYIKSDDVFTFTATPPASTVTSDVHTHTFTNNLAEGRLDLTKTGLTLTSFENGQFVWKERGLVGAEFAVYADGDIVSPISTVFYSDGDLVGTITTDANGKGVLEHLPLGNYTLVETKAPTGYVLDSTPIDFSVTYVDDETSIIVVTKTIVNDKQNVVLDVTKKEEGTETLLEGIEFSLYAEEDIVNYDGAIIVNKGDLLATTTSDANGKVNFGLDLPFSTYKISEEKTLWGYIKCDAQTVTTSYPDTTTEDSPYVNTFYNELVRGRLEVTKTGPTLSAFENGQFVWKERGLVGAEFTVYADGDILTPDMKVDEDGNRTKYYSDGDVVGVFTTDESGKGVLADLPLGNYLLVETKAPTGYVIDSTPISFSVEYVDDATPLIEITHSIFDEKQNLVLDITKVKSSETDMKLSGAVFELYAEEDIVNYDGTVIVTKGTLLATATSDAEGKVNFGLDLPFTKYKVIEAKAPNGYLETSQKYIIDAKYPDSTVTNAIYSDTFYNTNKYGLMYLAIDFETWERSNYQTEDSGEDGYSVVIPIKEGADKTAVVIFVLIGMSCVVGVGAVIFLYLHKKKKIKASSEKEVDAFNSLIEQSLDVAKNEEE